jgi:hypothetical protein
VVALRALSGDQDPSVREQATLGLGEHATQDSYPGPRAERLERLERAEQIAVQKLASAESGSPAARSMGDYLRRVRKAILTLAEK